MVFFDQGLKVVNLDENYPRCDGVDTFFFF